MEIKAAELVSIKQVPVIKVNGFSSSQMPDVLSVEEPLEISIQYGPLAARQQKNISVTMRTPGNDIELATGFLFTEGIIASFKDVAPFAGYAAQNNIATIALLENCVPHLKQADRNFYTTSSCGVCGKSSIASIKTNSPFKYDEKQCLQLDAALLYQLPGKLQKAQNNFSATGGIHASGLFNLQGELLLVREDVGRHNALDKIIGAAFLKNILPLQQYILLLSGRVSFELVQKAAMAGITVVAAIGAPSTLAVELAAECDITLLGFLKENRFNIYHQGKQVTIHTNNEDQN
jgi:FdhD protein